ncbi:ubiquitin-protein ligase E3A [Geopyxis carbonaria]|nr:ubiquitin-protein ligase E3A [Geopyxis carbonaria]
MPNWSARLLGSNSSPSARTGSNVPPPTLESPPSYHFLNARTSPHSRSKSHHITHDPSHVIAHTQPNQTLSQRRSEGDLLAAASETATGRQLDLGVGGIPRNGRMSNTRELVELMAGQCVCCDSTVRWPSSLTHFRCTICMTVNDISSPKITSTAPTDTNARRPPVSTERARKIIQRSMEELLNSLKSGDVLSESLHFKSLGPTLQEAAFDPTNNDPSVPPSRPPPPPPIGGGSGLRKFEVSPYIGLASKMFRPLEEYIQATFSSWECLNGSFIEKSVQDTSIDFLDSRKEQHSIEPDPDSIYIPVTERPGEKEALMLTVGRAVRRERANSRNDRGNKPHERRQSFRAPSGLDWSAATEFYDLLLCAGRDFESQLDQSYICGNSGGSLLDSPVHDPAQIKLAINEARTSMMKTLLKSTETLLKRPGRPLKRPEDIRFLLVILANPLLYPGSVRLNIHSSLASGSMAVDTHSTSPRTTSSSTSVLIKDTGPGYHSGILKRLFGLLSNLPNECHHYLVSWFSTMPEPHFRELVELGGSFTTYRLVRQENKLSSTRGKLPYGNDWQIKATARVMSLFDKANNNSLGRRKPSRTPLLPPHNEPTNSIAALSIEAQRQGQILPSSSFYNMRLDYCDLIADFDVWESKNAKFCFCQYPFYLSMGAKIQILEHDARRQMEVQARNAFITNISNRTSLSQYMVLKVRRECLVEDSLKGISESVGTMEDIKKGLRVEFLGEDGIDAGGLKKEWFLMVARDVFDPNHGLFIYEEDSNYCYFNPHSFESSEEFYLVGVLLGLAIYNSTILDITLPPYVFKKLIYFAPQSNNKGVADTQTRLPLRRTLEDLALLRPGLTRGLQKLLDFEGDVQETFCRDFVAEIERYGEKILVPLCPGGENRPVTNYNRKEFVDLYVKYILDTSVNRQFEPFKRGFYIVCGGNALSLFGPEEIELLVRGSPEPLDVQALKAVAVYDGWGSKNSPESDTVVKWFWKFFDKISPGEQRMLLSFITGSDRIPAMGTTNLIIKVVCLGQDCNRFPVARTCFNQICLWRYKKREKLETMLWRAVTESEGFGLK